MSKIIYICNRDGSKVESKEKLHAICKKIVPGNIIPTKPLIEINGDISYAVMNPTNSLLTKEKSLLLGKIYENFNDWNKPEERLPDGSYAIFRDSQENVEIGSDHAGSRTVWYYFDNDKFIASTSQRAIVMYLGNFEFNDSVIPWMMSTGGLGPVLSWDKRIKRVLLNSSIILDKSNWSISTNNVPLVFNEINKSKEDHEKSLREALNVTFENLDLDFSKWVLPLSGGYDSRGILCLILKNTKHQNLRAISWGLKSSINSKGNDAFVAKKLANHLNVPHKYFHTDLSDEPLEDVVNRFVLLGEGRIDHIRAYLDGFKLWKKLFEDGIQGVIRGDECFESTIETSPTMTRLMTGYSFCTDFTNLENYEEYGIPKQEFPEFLNRKENEPLAEWGHRLYLEYRLPTVNAALNDLKTPYVEIINPLLSKKILDVVSQSPVKLRADKWLIKKIITSISPKIEIAKSDAIANNSAILYDDEFLNILRNELKSKEAEIIFTKEFLAFVLGGIQINTSNNKKVGVSKKIKSFVKKVTPNFIQNMYKDHLMQVKLDPSTLAFRLFLVVRMNKILLNDSLIRLK